MEETEDDAVPARDDLVLVALMNRAALSLQEAGLTTEDLLAELDAVRDELLREDLGDAAVEALVRQHAALRRE